MNDAVLCCDCVLKTRLIEDFLEQELTRCMPGFSMTEFQSELGYVDLDDRHELFTSC